MNVMTDFVNARYSPINNSLPPLTSCGTHTPEIATSKKIMYLSDTYEKWHMHVNAHTHTKCTHQMHTHTHTHTYELCSCTYKWTKLERTGKAESSLTPWVRSWNLSKTLTPRTHFLGTNHGTTVTIFYRWRRCQPTNQRPAVS